MPLLPELTSKGLEAQAAAVVEVAESRNPDQKRTAVRLHVAAIEADPKARTLGVLMHPDFGVWLLNGSARGNRTPAASVKGMYPNR